MRTAWNAIHMRGNLLKNRPQCFVGLRRSPGHDGGPQQSALLATGDTGTNKVQSVLTQLGLAPSSIGKVGVARINNNVALFQQQIGRASCRESVSAAGGGVEG